MKEHQTSQDMKMNEREIEEKLSASETVSDVIKSLPDDTVSLSWRSELNQKLMATQKPRKSWLGYWRPALGLSLAGALAVAYFMPVGEKKSVTPSPAGVEAELLSAHKDILHSRDLSESGLTAFEISRANSNVMPRYNYSEVDLGTL